MKTASQLPEVDHQANKQTENANVEALSGWTRLGFAKDGANENHRCKSCRHDWLHTRENHHSSKPSKTRLDMPKTQANLLSPVHRH